jgi:diguanylate cyclase (GGDEF)-like protein/hemerythrin-like metal-binding protein
MESFHWNKYFETGLVMVDTQHRGLVDLINRLGALLIQPGGASLADINTLFNELAAYAIQHFQEEERLMQEAGLDPRHILQHKKSHADFVQDVSLLHQRASAQQETSEALLKFLTYWLTYHILGTDQSMAKQIAAIKAGKTPQDALAAESIKQEGATGPLLNALNGLFQQVSERNRELQELNRTLEAKVAERTRALSEANQFLEQLALTDVLTGLPNRRQAMAWLAQSWAQSQREHVPLSCMMIDIDDFKQINDRHGHAGGDEVLRALATHLRTCLRGSDIVCRLGGDEFLIICPGTALSGSLRVAETMRRSVAKLRVPIGDQEWMGSISVGVAEKTPEMPDLDALIKAADEGLYVAKDKGRNNVGCAQTALA